MLVTLFTCPTALPAIPIPVTLMLPTHPHHSCPLPAATPCLPSHTTYPMLPTPPCSLHIIAFPCLSLGLMPHIPASSQNNLQHAPSSGTTPLGWDRSCCERVLATILGHQKVPCIAVCLPVASVAGLVCPCTKISPLDPQGDLEHQGLCGRPDRFRWLFPRVLHLCLPLPLRGPATQTSTSVCRCLGHQPLQRLPQTWRGKQIPCPSHVLDEVLVICSTLPCLGSSQGVCQVLMV